VRIVFLGSGAFGLPTLERLLAEHEIALVVSQPDRPAGRGRHPTPTPIVARVAALGQDHPPIPLLCTARVNEPAVVQRIHDLRPDALVVIAFGQKLGPALLDGVFAVNLHGSLLPRHRGAAPINWTMLAGDSFAGVTAITLAERMDAGAMLGSVSTPIDPAETAGELHDRLAELGAPLMLQTLACHRDGTLGESAQDESQMTLAPKLSRADAWVRFDTSADEVRRRIHGLTPWPGVSVHIGAKEARLLRVAEDATDPDHDVDGPSPPAPGTIDANGRVRCATGSVRILEIQPAGGRPMTWDAFARGHAVPPGTIIRSCVEPR